MMASMAEIAIRDVFVAGVRSRVREAGPKHLGEAVIFLHGNPGSGEDWIDLMGRASAFARAVAPDMPGFGKADRPRDFEYTVSGYASHFGALVDELGIDRAHLVLHDFGGPWGLAWAAEHPKSVASLTLINIGILPGYRWHKYARIWQTRVVGELFQILTTRAAFRMSLNADNPKPFPRAFADRMYDDFDRGTKRAILKLYRATSDLDGISRALGDRLSPLHLPTLVLWGTGDAYLPARYAGEQRKFFDPVEVHLLAGCGHWPFVDEPERTAALIIPFLRKQLGSNLRPEEKSNVG
jgi:pimeloyl-ACP methyl ester carboxylesterase